MLFFLILAVAVHTSQGWTNLNDGKWSCSWMLSNKLNCRDGEFACNCPGDGKEVTFKIGCCMRKFKCGTICNENHNCWRFQNCHSCHTKVETMDYTNVCTSCKPGWLLGKGNCQKDLNECKTNNGGCEHTCKNTLGSYYCSCKAGYYLSSDRHACIKRLCDYPSELVHGSVDFDDEMRVESGAIYKCDHNYVAIGTVWNPCVATKSLTGKQVEWKFEQPQCQATCKLPAEGNPTTCGYVGIDEQTCEQYGCCYDGQKQLCYLQPKKRGYVTITDKDTPISTEGELSPLQSNFDESGYHYMCDHHKDGCNSVWTWKSEENKYFRKSILRSNNVSDYPDLFFDADENIAIDVSLRIDEHLDFDEELTLTKLSAGCYRGESNGKLIISDVTMNVKRCISICHVMGERFADMKQDSCQCSSAPAMGRDDTIENCNVNCIDGMQCGAVDKFSRYYVPEEESYLGCFSLPGIKVQVNTFGSSSISRCVELCGSEGIKYAVIIEGSCTCVSDVDVSQEENKCINDVNHTYYRVHNAQTVWNIGEVSAAPQNTHTLTYGKLKSLTFYTFTALKHLKNFMSDQLAIFTDEVTTVIEQKSLVTKYEQCGEIYHEEAVTDLEDDIVIRAFLFNIDDLPKYVSEKTKRVYIYALTVVINSDVMVDYSLYINAQQLALNRNDAIKISIPENSKPLTDTQLYELDSDVLFSRMAYVCANILIEAKEMSHHLTGMNILNGLSMTYSSDAEKIGVSEHVSSTKIYFSGIELGNIHFVPFYTKSQYSKMLQTYYDSISVYKTDYMRLLDKSISDEMFKNYIRSTQKSFVTANVHDAQNDFDETLKVLKANEATYIQLKKKYSSAIASLDSARSYYEMELSKGGNAITSLILPFFKALANAVSGVFNKDVDSVKESVTGFIDEAQDIDTTMSEVGRVVRIIDIMTLKAAETINLIEDMSEDLDYKSFVDDIDATIKLQETLVAWQQIQDQTKIVLSNKDAVKTNGCKEYVQAVLQVANWGTVVTRSTVEKAELMRQLISKRSILKNRVIQEKQINSLLNDMENKISSKNLIIQELQQQSYDIRIDLNYLLHEFCQAYFYENLAKCKPTYQPSFGGSLSSLLLKISAARRDALLSGNGISSTVTRSIKIADTETDPSCLDVNVCPINFFKKNRALLLKIDANDHQFSDLAMYKITEIKLEVNGAKSTSDNKFLQIKIMSSGEFGSKSLKGEKFNFLSKPTSLNYEYNIETGDITLHADVYNSFREIVSHITPFTTWVMTVSDIRSSDISLEDVSDIKVSFLGYAMAIG